MQILGENDINSSNNSIDFPNEHNEEQKVPLLQENYMERDLHFNSVTGKLSELTINKNDDNHQSMEPQKSEVAHMRIEQLNSIHR